MGFVAYFQPSNGSLTQLQVKFPGGYMIQQVPRWIDDSEPKRIGTVERSITGVLSLQEVDRKWVPITLEFKGSNLPSAMLDETLLALFLSAQNAGGIHHLRLVDNSATAGPAVTGGVTVMFDWERSGGHPVQYNLLTPVGEQNLDPITNVVNAAGGYPGKLYEATIYFLWLNPS